MRIHRRDLLKAIGATALLAGVVAAAIAIVLWVDTYYHTPARVLPRRLR